MIITGKKFSKPEMSRVKNGDLILPDNDNHELRKRLDLILVEKHPEFNRSTLQNFIKSGYVTIDEKVVTKPNAYFTIEKAGAEIKHQIILNIPQKSEPKDLKDILIYQDNNILVLNKPAGLLSMAKGEFTTENTLEDYGLLVHRLDRDTSGVVILAKNEATQSMLRKQFQERKAHKIYYAITNGIPKNPKALIDLPIARNLKNPTSFQVDPNGKPAQTYYKVIETRHNKALIELRPITGRTHQLRVHLRYIGCPIIGDKVYGKDGHTKSSSSLKNHNQTSKSRLFLHAAELEITIPSSPENLRKTFKAPLPLEFKDELKG